MCSYSSVGPTLYDEFAKPDLVAPGNHLVSLRAPWSWVDLTYPQTRVAVSSYVPGAPSWLPSSYAVMSGTSASAPVVAGAAALLLQRDPSLTPGDVKLRLMDSADPLPGATSYAEGAGELNVAARSGRHGHDQRLRPVGQARQRQYHSADRRPAAVAEVRMVQICMVQVRLVEVCMVKVRMVQVRVVEVRMVKVRMVGRDRRAVTQDQTHPGRPVTAARPRAAVTLYVALTLVAAAVCSFVGLRPARTSCSSAAWSRSSPCPPSPTCARSACR